MLNQLLILGLSIFFVVKGATLSTKFAKRLAESFRMSKYLIGFIVVAVISILPETFIAVNSAISGIPEFGLGMLFGSNIADLTLVFSLIIFYVGRGIKIESKILKNNSLYPFLLLLPVVLGFDGYFSRVEGIALIIAGVFFYYSSFRNDARKISAPHTEAPTGHSELEILSEKYGRFNTALHKNGAGLLGSIALLLIGSHFTVSSASTLASMLGVSPILIGMLVVGLGTTLPELFFSLKSVANKDDDLAVGDMLGTILIDATVVVGIIAIVSPFAFPARIIHLTGTFMVIMAFVLFYFMRSGRRLSKMEGRWLFGFWLAFVFVEFMVNS